MAKVADKAPGELDEKLDEKTEVKTAKGKRGGARPNTGGRRPGSGRKPGSPNKLTSDIKAAILEAFQEAGGAAYLKQVALDNPQVFCTLVGKVLPMQVTGENGKAIQIKWSNDAD